MRPVRVKRDDPGVEGWPTPEEAALDTMPRAITHVVQTVCE
jgi:hypothetical protein